ncbi:MAG TPA: hypothetical protein VN660_13355 [Steroidobacteraceae bacterium]|nr:hypothetical protein [Steroidobacteraceae bacterium]
MIYDVIAARALHVLAVVIWIGGMSLITTVALPAIRRGEIGQSRMQAFHAVERRFVWQARTAVVVVAVTGVYMLWRLSLWNRFHAAMFWWMHAMVCLWLIFALILFVVEPLSSRRRQRHAEGSQEGATAQVEINFALMQWVHWALLVLSIVTVLGAVAGSHGWSVF